MRAKTITKGSDWDRVMREREYWGSFAAVEMLGWTLNSWTDMRRAWYTRPDGSEVEIDKWIRQDIEAMLGIRSAGVEQSHTARQNRRKR